MSKKDFKVLRYISRRARVPASELDARFDELRISDLFSSGAIKGSLDQKENVLYYSLGRFGTDALDDSRWFDLRYVITQILVPVLIGIGSAVITEVLIRIFL